jgi:outer membrane protein assembly factor BamB
MEPACQVLPDRQWGQYRGFMASGVLDGADLPERWDSNGTARVLWKSDIPGLGLSCPVVWGDHLFVTTAIGKDTASYRTGIYGDIEPVSDSSEHTWKVICLDKNNGKVNWEVTACTGIPKQKRHPKSSHANSSVAADGKNVVAFFGSEGLYCYDMKGNLKWKKDFGLLKSVFFAAPEAEWEFATSPILYNGILVIQCDVLENSFLAAYDADSGKELWKKTRDEYPGWCTPNIYRHDGKTRIAVNGYKHRGGYDLYTGEEIWRMEGGGDIPIPTPVTGNGLIYFNSAHGPSSPVMAVKESAHGNISLYGDQAAGEFIAWSIPKGGSYMQTLLLYSDYLYNCNWNGRVNCYEALTGKEVYKEMLGKARSFTGSPVVSDGRIFIADEEGVVHVFAAGPAFRPLGTYSLGDICLTTPAITDGMIIFRTVKHLIAIGK